MRSLLAVTAAVVALSMTAPDRAGAESGVTAERSAPVDLPADGAILRVSPDDSDTAEERQALSEDDGNVNGLVVGLILIGVFVGGLAWIRSQRRSGRTSKFPRIG